MIAYRDTDWADVRAQEERRIRLAVAAYNAVWQSWHGLDARNVDECRTVAMAAALAVAQSE